MLQPAFYSPTTLHHWSLHRLCITGVVHMGWAIISVAELSAMKAIAEHPELPLTKSSLSPLNSQLTKTSQASSLGVIIPKAQGQWRNQKKQTHPVVYCMFCLTVYRKKTNIHSSNWKMCSYDSIIIMYLPCFQRVTATPVQRVQFDLELMRLGLLTNVGFYFVCSALGNVVMAYFIICYDSVQISHLHSFG